jgi:subtilisin family serine protease
MRKKIALLLFSLIFSANFSSAQTAKYWVFFTEKTQENYTPEKHLSPAALQNRKLLNLPLFAQSDIPLQENYLKKIASQSSRIINTSKWLNAVTADLTSEQLAEVKKNKFVTAVEPVNLQFTFTSAGAPEYGTAVAQINPTAFEGEKLTAKGVKIGVIDAGFYLANESELLKNIFEEKRIKFFRDFVSPAKEKFFEESETSQDEHGTNVMEMIAGEIKGESKTGFATDAEFYLARTDHGSKEFRGEEDYWIRALEMMDSLGVRLINTSLGYGEGFDKSEENYLPQNMDGKTTKVSQAATIAARDKGMIIIVSAGNEGGGKWRVITAPADSPEVLSVAANNHNGLRAGYSSVGPENLPYMKPNISAYSMTGTSFSAPVITGFAACLLQKKPELSRKELFSIIEQSGSIYPYGNNFLGYGIPDCGRALEILAGKEVKKIMTEVKVKKNEYKISVDNEVEKAIIFHKKDKFYVIEQNIEEPVKGKIMLKRIKDAAQTTVWLGDSGIEIIWE